VDSSNVCTVYECILSLHWQSLGHPGTFRTLNLDMLLSDADKDKAQNICVLINQTINDYDN